MQAFFCHSAGLSPSGKLVMKYSGSTTSRTSSPLKVREKPLQTRTSAAAWASVSAIFSCAASGVGQALIAGQLSCSGSAP